MKNYIQKYICKSATLFVGASLMLTGCSESFLDPDPQTMFEPETVFSTENGIKSVSRYYIQGDFTYDGTEQFKPGNRFKFFPTVSAAWVGQPLICREWQILLPYLNCRTHSSWHTGCNPMHRLSIGRKSS